MIHPLAFYLCGAFVWYLIYMKYLFKLCFSALFLVLGFPTLAKFPYLTPIFLLMLHVVGMDSTDVGQLQGTYYHCSGAA